MERRKSIVATSTAERRKSIVPPSTAERRKSIVGDATAPAASQQKRKSIIPSSFSTANGAATATERKKSTITPSASPSASPSHPAQRRKSIVADALPPIKKRPTSLLQTNSRATTIPSSRSTAVPNRRTIVPPKQPTQSTAPIKRARANTFASSPVSILKSRTPITAPTTPDAILDDEQDEERRLELEQAEFDNLCLENTNANAAIVSSPVSIEKEDEEDEEDDKDEEEEEEDAIIEQIQREPVYGSLASTRPISKSDQTVPLKDYEELRFKLKILENKRHEDRERFRDHEKVKEEAEQFLTLRNKLQDKIAELQKDVRDTKRELKDTIADKETFENKYNDLLESMEMLTLDKEVAEERAESLQQETNMLKERMEEISIDLDILKKEADILNKPPELSPASNEERTPLEIVQLERHNERLKEALLRFRDATAENENELNNKIKLLEHENYELEEIRLQYEKALEKLSATEMSVDDLKMQLDDALGAEDLVDQLTERNLSLTEKLDELSATVDDLEALKELADELEENHVETEKQLQAEIDHRDMLLREQLERLRANEETAADYEATIQQFRELVVLLQSDLEGFKSKEQTEQSEKKTLSSQSQAMMSLNFQLQTTVMKAQAKAIDIELRKLEAAQANERLNMIQPYLPESFFKTENDPISCLLLFKRLEFKAGLIVKHLDQNYPISEKIMDNVTDNLVTICEMKSRAGWLSSLATRFQTYIKNCDVGTFSKMGRVYHDLIGVERKMNAIVELFRTDQVNEAHCLTELQRIIAQVEHLAESHLQQQERNNTDQFFGLTKALDLNADRMIVILTCAKQSLYNAARVEGIVVAEGIEQVDQDYNEPLGRLIAQAKNSKIVAKKLMRQLEDIFEEAMTLKPEHLHRFRMLYAISTKLCKFCFDTYKNITAYIDTKRGSHEEIELSHIQTLLRDKGDEIFEMVESSMWENALRNVKTLNNELGATYAQIEQDDKLDKIKTNVAPWIQRASDIKAEVAVNHELEHKLQQHNDEIIKLIKDVRMKDQSLQEADVKTSLLEKRIEVAKKEMARIKSLEDDLDKSLNQEQMYVEAMENLQNEYDQLEIENSQLKKEASKREEKRQSILRKANFDLAEGEDSEHMQEMAGGYYEMAGHMETLKASIRYLRAENAQLKSSDLWRSLDLSTPAPAIKKQHRGEMMSDIARETRALLKDMRVASASPRVIQLPPATRKWSSMKKTPDYQYQTQQSVLYTLQQRSVQLRRKVDDLQITTDKFPATHNEKKPLQQLGLIKIPRLPSMDTTISHHCIDVSNASDFKRLHSVFIHS
ncbi:dynein associated protein-domain-containing protein [Parasitella parasitica]|nr:dynein associated protein-domain-containing protein [Parasitella parasitica]